MITSVHDYEYYLPENLIAQTPANPRESARLMVIHKNTDDLLHHHVSDLPEFFHSGDVVVINNSKVFHARLHGKLENILVEVFLIRPRDDSTWIVLGKPGKKFIVKQSISIAPDFTGVIEEKNPDGTMIINFHESPDAVITKANLYGEVPVPPYIKTIPKDEDYQTVYASQIGSVAAPTAGFHLTKNILSTLKQKGVTIVEITLHVGLGTFMPMKSETVESHAMHSEWVEVTPDTVQIINEAKISNRRIIAIGTTSVRTLEGVASQNNGTLVPYKGDVNIFIKEGYQFHVIDAMLTNFHLPKSTLLVLVSAFAGHHAILHAYKTAVEEHYRFYSFGDAMLIVP
jgi:S-adenosylmethionine:tRNA ribosyltransferase-isomerase